MYRMYSMYSMYNSMYSMYNSPCPGWFEPHGAVWDIGSEGVNGLYHAGAHTDVTATDVGLSLTQSS